MSNLEGRLARDARLRRRIEDYITEHEGQHPAVRQVAAEFGVPESHAAAIMGLMTQHGPLPRHGRPETAPDVRTPPAEVLDILVAAMAASSTAVLACLMSCRMCRNRLLYLLDTAPYAGDQVTASQAILARLRAMPDNHKLHQSGGSDSSPPRIRWIAP